MLGFILSKINLLILVVAIFAIVSFFTLGLTELAKINEARLLLDRVSQKSFSLVSSPSYCFSDSFDLPRFIRVAGEDYYYVMKISVETIKKEDGQKVSVVIFSIHPRVEYVKFIQGDRETEPPSVAASSFRTTAQVALYSKNYKGDRYVDNSGSAGSGGVKRVDSSETFSSDPNNSDQGLVDGIIVDPKTTNPYNTVEFLKEIRGGESYVYIFPCNAEFDCVTTKEYASYEACDDTSIPGMDCDKYRRDEEVWFNC